MDIWLKYLGLSHNYSFEYLTRFEIYTIIEKIITKTFQNGELFMHIKMVNHIPKKVYSDLFINLLLQKRIKIVWEREG